MSFHFSAAGSPEEVVGQLMSAQIKDDLGEDIRQLLLKHLNFPKVIGPQDRPVFSVQVIGSSSPGALTSLYVETNVAYVPYVKASTAERARLHLEKGQPVPEGD